MKPQHLAIIVISIIIAVIILLIMYYRHIVMPMRRISNGMDLIRSQDFSSRLALTGNEKADKIIEMFNAMMLSLKNERLRIREQNHFLDLLISVSPMGILILDTWGNITMHNPAASQFLATADLQGRKLDEIDSDIARGVSGLAQGQNKTLRLSDSKIYRCQRLSFMDNGYAHPFILIEPLTQEVMKAEKRAYEKVIRMISHEVNNSVAGITSMLSTVSSIMHETPGPDTDNLSDIMDACSDRCFAMSRFISSFADVVRIPEASLKRSRLNTSILAEREFLESMCSTHGVALELDLCQADAEIMIDNVLFDQALINIVKNSIDSISTVNGGEEGIVRITTCSIPGPTITVTDNGAGLSDESKAHVFTPFYSTKPDGQGLGLIFISDVLVKHGCDFSLITSPKDSLTRFTIRFPKL